LLQPSRSRKKTTFLAITMMLVAVAAVAVAGVLYYACANGVCFGGAGGPQEYIVLTNYTIGTAPSQQNPTVLTLWLKSTGSDTAILSSLTINDLTSNSSQAPFPVSVSIPPQTTKAVTVDTATSGFYFTSGHIYSVLVSTSHNQFNFQLNYT
jgi:hypothetical protein